MRGIAVERMGREETPTKPPSIAVVEAVAAENGVEPAELDCILADVIDPVALDALFASTPDRRRDSGVVEFPFCDCAVTVRADGTVDVR